MRGVVGTRRFCGCPASFALPHRASFVPSAPNTWAVLAVLIRRPRQSYLGIPTWAMISTSQVYRAGEDSGRHVRTHYCAGEDIGPLVSVPEKLQVCELNNDDVETNATMQVIDIDALV